MVSYYLKQLMLLDEVKQQLLQVGCLAALQS